MAKGNTDDLVEEVEQTRDRLAGTVDELVDRVNPKNAAKRSAGNIKARFMTESGEPRMESIIPVALGVAGFIAVIVAIRRVVR